MLHALLLATLAQHPLAADDAAARLAAVSKWSRGQKPQLSAKDARALGAECVELPAVKETGCEVPARLCRLVEGDDGSSGTRVEALSFHLEGHEKPVRVWWAATYEPRRFECDPPERLDGADAPAQREAEVAAWRKAHAKEWQRCLARVEKDARDDAEELACDVVLINACRAEAFLTCRARNLRKGVVALEHLHRVSFD
ncbi:MAG: hypothetical protein ACOZQL_37870 [Myxococcota bacterium]